MATKQTKTTTSNITKTMKLTMTRTEDGEWGVSARHPGAICWVIAFGDTPADALRRMARHMVQYRKLHGIEWFEER